MLRLVKVRDRVLEKRARKQTEHAISHAVAGAHKRGHVATQNSEESAKPKANKAEKAQAKALAGLKEQLTTAKAEAKALAAQLKQAGAKPPPKGKGKGPGNDGKAKAKAKAKAKGSRSRSSSRGSAGSDSEITCFKCGEKGHRKANCPESDGASSTSSSTGSKPKGEKACHFHQPWRPDGARCNNGASCEFYHARNEKEFKAKGGGKGKRRGSAAVQTAATGAGAKAAAAMLAAAGFAVTEGQALHCVAEIGDCDGMSNLAAVTLRLPSHQDHETPPVTATGLLPSTNRGHGPRPLQPSGTLLSAALGCPLLVATLWLTLKPRLAPVKTSVSLLKPLREGCRIAGVCILPLRRSHGPQLSGTPRPLLKAPPHALRHLAPRPNRGKGRSNSNRK